MQNSLERFDASMPFQPFPAHRLLPRHAVLEEIMRPCSRFKSSLSWDARVEHKIAMLAGRFDIFSRNAFLSTPGVPLNWQILLDFLYESGIASSRSFVFSSRPTNAPKTYSAYLGSRTHAADTDGGCIEGHGFGSAGSVEESMSRAVGELLERYFLTVYRQLDMRTESYAAAKKRDRNALDIFSLNDFLPWQKKENPLLIRSADIPLSWVEGCEITKGVRAHIPSQLVYWNYRFRSGETIFMHPTTSGSAGHFSRDEAILAGLLELIQRDGFLIYWLNGLSPKRIDPSTIIDPEVKEFLLYLRRYGLEYFFLNTTTDIGVPSCACVLVDMSGEEPTMAMGGGTGFSLKEIILHSAREAISIYESVSVAPRTPFQADRRAFTALPGGRTERLRLWKGRDMYERIKFFISGPYQSFEGFMGEAVWRSTPESRLLYILDRLRDLGEGYEAFVFEVKHPLLEKLGFHVVKTIVPQLVPLYLRENLATLAAHRLTDVPTKLGYAAAKTFTPWPHPFP